MAQQAGRGSVDPGQLEKRLPVPEVRPRIGRRPVLAAPEAAPARPAEGAFILSAVDVVGATVYSAAELGPYYEPYLARRVSPADVQRILDGITTRYRDDGYILSWAEALPQAAELGILRVRIIEGHVEKVALTGDMRGHEKLLRTYADKIARSRPLTRAALERYVLLMNDLPGVTVKPDLEPVDEPAGVYRLSVAVKQDRVAGFAALDNRGTRPAGVVQGLIGADFNALIGNSDTSRLLFFTVPAETEELLFLLASHQQPLGGEGTTLALTAWVSRSEAGGNLNGSNIEGRGRSVTLKLSHPLRRGRDHSLFVDLTFDYLDSDQDQLGVASFEDRLRVARLGIEYAFQGRWGGETIVGGEASKGLKLLNASSESSSLLSRAGGRGDFTKLTLDASHTRKLVGNWSLALAAVGQASGEQLLSSEEFQLGGAAFGRAYDPSELTGDRGAAGSLEIRYGRDQGVKAVPREYQLYGFYDLGAVWDDDADNRTTRRSLASMGVGARLTLGQRIEVDLQVAKPLTRRVEERGDDGSDVRFFFSLSAGF